MLTPDCVPSPRDIAFLEGLRHLGYTLGKDIIVDSRCYASDTERRSRFDALVVSGIDVLFLTGPAAALMAATASPGLPVVCGSCGDPIETGIVTSLGRPGGNVTGLASLSAELIAKRIQLIKEVIPSATRVAVLVNPANPGTPLTVRALEPASRASGVALELLHFGSVEDLAHAFGAAAKAQVDAVLVADDPYAFSGRMEVARHALSHRLPTIAGQIQNAEGCWLTAPTGTTYSVEPLATWSKS